MQTKVGWRALLHRFDARRSLPYFLIRVFLGFALFIRGAIFVGDQEALMNLIVARGLDWFVPAFLIHYITLAHLVGGPMLTVGLLTRAAALSQIPILLGAVFFVHLQEGLFAAGQSLELAVLVLFLLVLVFLAGPGELSIDYYLFARKDQPEPEAADATGIPPSGILAPHPRHTPAPRRASKATTGEG